MQKLTIKYNRKDFFGNRIYTEDTKENFTKTDMTKAFLFLKKMVSVRIYDGKNYTTGKTPFDVIKKNFYAKFRNVDQAAWN